MFWKRLHVEKHIRMLIHMKCIRNDYATKLTIGSYPEPELIIGIGNITRPKSGLDHVLRRMSYVLALRHIRMHIHVNSISGMHVIQKPYLIALRHY